MNTRQEKIPTFWRNAAVFTAAVYLLTGTSFDMIGIEPLVEWLAIIIGFAGVAVGAYFLYLRTK